MTGDESSIDEVLPPEQAHGLPARHPQTPPAPVLEHGAPQHAKKRRKIKSAEVEELHAVSQRLLRETPNACFTPQITSGKSITSVLEKIRLRKKQLAAGRRSAFSILLPDSSDSLEILNDESSSFGSFAIQDQNGAEVGEMITVRKFQKTVDLKACDEEVNAEKDENNADATKTASQLKASGHLADDAEDLEYIGSRNTFRAPLEDTQELLSFSEGSENDKNENPDPNQEDDDIIGSRVNLHLGTETQDDYDEWLDEDANKENVEPALPGKFSSRHIFNGPSIRALIDDEAEDEDEEDLVPGEDDEGDEGKDLDDMVVEETNEKESDREKRAELHRKWLEQQDAVMTDDILLRLKTGWRPRECSKRGLDFIDDDLELSAPKVEDMRENPDEDLELQENKELLDEDGQDSESLNDDADHDDDGTFKPLEDLKDLHESSDDEEADHRMMRERFLQESEEQGEFMSPADDETSREIFGLINKVNKASTNKKPKNGNVNDLRYVGGGTSGSNSSASKSSFLRRSFSATYSVVQRQASSAGSGTRSFIFGRDDSNSSHSFDQHAASTANKENLEPTAQEFTKDNNHSRHSEITKDNSRASKSSATRLGPSLFEILRRQSTNLDLSAKRTSEDANHPISPIFSAFKPMKSADTPRGSRRM